MAANKIIYTEVTNEEIKWIVETFIQNVSNQGLNEMEYVNMMATLVHELYHNKAGQANGAKFIALNIREYVFFRHPDGKIHLEIVKDEKLKEKLGKGTWFGYFDKTGKDLDDAMIDTLEYATYGTLHYTMSPIDAVKTLTFLSPSSIASLEQCLPKELPDKKKKEMLRNNPIPERVFLSRMRAIESKNCDQAWSGRIKKELKERDSGTKSSLELNDKFKLLGEKLNSASETKSKKLKGPAKAHAAVIIAAICK